MPPRSQARRPLPLQRCSRHYRRRLRRRARRSQLHRPLRFRSLRRKRASPRRIRLPSSPRYGPNLQRRRHRQAPPRRSRPSPIHPPPHRRPSQFRRPPALPCLRPQPLRRATPLPFSLPRLQVGSSLLPQQGGAFEFSSPWVLFLERANKVFDRWSRHLFTSPPWQRKTSRCAQQFSPSYFLRPFARSPAPRTRSLPPTSTPSPPPAKSSPTKPSKAKSSSSSSGPLGAPSAPTKPPSSTRSAMNSPANASSSSPSQ